VVVCSLCFPVFLRAKTQMSEKMRAHPLTVALPEKVKNHTGSSFQNLRPLEALFSPGAATSWWLVLGVLQLSSLARGASWPTQANTWPTTCCYCIHTCRVFGSDWVVGCVSRAVSVGCRWNRCRCCFWCAVFAVVLSVLVSV